MKKVRTELVRIEKKLKAERDETAKVQIVTDEYAAIMPELERGLSELDKFMKKVAFETDAQGAKFKSRIKPIASVLNKVMKRGKSLSGMADLVGGMILVDNTEQAKAIFDKIKKKYSSQALQTEEKTKSGDDVFGYHGTYHVDILMPGSDVVGELQIMTKKKLEVYNGAAHKIYNKYRDKDDAAVRAKIPAEQGHMSRKLFSLGNKSKKLREYIEALMNGTLNETKDFDKRPVSLDEVERENVASEYLTEGMLDEHFISAPRINSAAVEKLLGNPAKILVSTDGKWVVSGTGDGIAVMSSSKLGQAGTIDGVEFKTGDTSMRAAVVAAFAKGVEAAVKSDMAKPMKVAATSGFTFNPYAMKNVKAYTKSMPLRGSVTVTDLIAMAAGGMLKDSQGGSNVVQSLYTVLTRGESAFKVSASDATLVGYAASFKMDESMETQRYSPSEL